MRVLFDGIILLCIASFFHITDKNKCGNGDNILFLHHIISNFLNFGWLSNNVYTLYLFVLTSVVTWILWTINNDSCFLTQINNKLCGRPEKAMYYDFWVLIGIKHYKCWRSLVLPFYISVTWGFAVYKLINRRAFKLDSSI